MPTGKIIQIIESDDDQNPEYDTHATAATSRESSLNSLSNASTRDASLFDTSANVSDECTDSPDTSGLVDSSDDEKEAVEGFQLREGDLEDLFDDSAPSIVLSNEGTPGQKADDDSASSLSDYESSASGSDSENEGEDFHRSSTSYILPAVPEFPSLGGPTPSSP
jgi:hypothetical protein